MHAKDAYSTPLSFLLNKEEDIVWEKQGFVGGDETCIYDEIKKNPSSSLATV